MFSVVVLLNRLSYVVPVLLRSKQPVLPTNTRWRSLSRIRMPKNQKGRGQQTGAGAAEPLGVCPVGRDRSGAVTVTVRAKPGCKHSSVTAVSTEAVEVAIAAPPVDGEANVELIRFLAEVLELKKSHLYLDKGSRSRDKQVRVDSSLCPEEVLRRLRQAIG